LAAAVDEAIERWSASGLSRRELARLNRVTSEIADLPDGQLGAAAGTRIQIDPTAAGWGWFVDSNHTAGAQSRIDLLTVVVHELGHALGRGHAPGVMAATLPTGVRRLPPPGPPGEHRPGVQPGTPKGGEAR
jgi:hypothetical protein